MTTRIYCPRCEWAPSPHDEWECAPGCTWTWNTFDTHACCPACAKQWTVTVCLACYVGSAHDDWYHDEATDQDAWTDAVEHEACTEPSEREELVEVGAGSGRDYDHHER